MVVKDDGTSYQERPLAQEKRERRAAEVEQLVRDSGCRILVDNRMVPMFTLEAEASCAATEGLAALASKKEVERALLRICSVSESTHQPPNDRS